MGAPANLANHLGMHGPVRRRFRPGGDHRAQHLVRYLNPWPGSTIYSVRRKI
jgi:hypothetical protein